MFIHSLGFKRMIETIKESASLFILMKEKLMVKSHIHGRSSRSYIKEGSQHLSFPLRKRSLCTRNIIAAQVFGDLGIKWLAPRTGHICPIMEKRIIPGENWPHIEDRGLKWRISAANSAIGTSPASDGRTPTNSPARTFITLKNKKVRIVYFWIHFPCVRFWP